MVKIMCMCMSACFYFVCQRVPVDTEADFYCHNVFSYIHVFGGVLCLCGAAGFTCKTKLYFHTCMYAMQM